MFKRFTGIVLCLLGLIAAPLSFSVQAYNSGAHLYIAEQVFPNASSKNDLYYGAVAPDIASFLSNPGKWPTAMQDTHYAPDLRSYANTATQLSFADGWASHSEAAGADFYAHISFNNAEGYVIVKQNALVNDLNIDPTFAHTAIEVAVDLLVKWNMDPALGSKLLKASLLRSWEDRFLLSRVMVFRFKRTDWCTLVSDEVLFRSVLTQYAKALSRQSPGDKKALAQLGAQLATLFYGLSVTPQEVEVVLEKALKLCESDYREAIEQTVTNVRLYLAP